MIGSIEATGHVHNQTEAKPPAVEEVPAAQPPPARESDSAATYMPVRMSYATDAEVLVTQYQNVMSGEVRKQIPDPAMLETYRSRAAFGQPLETPQQSPEAKTDSNTPGQGSGDSQDGQPVGLGVGGAGAPAATGPAPMGSGGAGMSAPERPVGGAVAPPIRTTA
jgi:hypothetical protein